MAKCPKCGSEILDERANFCEHCGYDVRHASGSASEPGDGGGIVIDSPEKQESTQAGDIEPSEPSEPSASPQPSEPSKSSGRLDARVGQDKTETYLKNLQTVWADGKMSFEDAQALGQLREILDITPDAEKQLTKKTIDSFRPIQRDEVSHPEAQSVSRGLALSINTNQLYIAGFRGVIHLKAENLSSTSFDEVELELSSSLLVRTERWRFQLGAQQSTEKRFVVRLSEPGFDLVQFRVTCRLGNSVFSFWAEETLPILPKPENVQDVGLQADNLLNLGGTGDKWNMGGVVHVHVNELIKHKQVKTPFELVMEYSKLPAAFTGVSLEFDPQRSEQITQAYRRECAPGGRASKCIVAQGRGRATQQASLRLQSADCLQNILLVSKATATLGRNRQNDIVVRIAPRSPENDLQSKKISNLPHCRITLEQQGLRIKDADSDNGTTLDGQVVDQQGEPIAAHCSALCLARVLTLKPCCEPSLPAAESDCYEQLRAGSPGSLWTQARRAKVSALSLKRLGNLGVDDVNGHETYVLVYQRATIGSSPHCTICFPDRGLEGVHAGIVYLDGGYYLENLCGLSDVVVNDVVLSKGELIGLKFGDQLYVGRVAMAFEPGGQLFLDVHPSSS